MLNSRVDKVANDEAANDAVCAHPVGSRLNDARVNAFARGGGVAVFVSIALLLLYASFGGTNSWLSGALCGVLGLAALWVWIALRGDAFPNAKAASVHDRGAARHLQIQRLANTSEASDEHVEDIHDNRWTLLESAEHLRELLDSQDALIVKCTSAGIITFVNQAFCRATGHTRDEILGHSFQPTLVGDCGGTFKGELPFASCGVTTQTLVLSRSRRIISWEVHTLPHNGGVPEVQLVGHDVTEQVQRAKRLQSAREEAEAGNRAKSRFLAAMSHEIRTPMNGILGLTSLLKETSLDPEQKAYCESISQSGRNLLGLIDEILDFSKIEAGKISLSAEPFSLETCAQNAVELLVQRAHEKNLELAWCIDPQICGEVVGDATRVQQILLNLISNAIKFTDVGGVSLYGSLSECRRNVEIVVADTGIGLSQRECETLFQEFEQTEAAVRRQSGGTGLGLAIGRTLARAMGGDIRVKSELGRGTQFTFHMPFRPRAEASQNGSALGPAAAGERQPPGESRVARRRVLVVSDRLIERTAMMRVLRAHYADVVCAKCADVIETVSDLDADRNDFDCVVFDAGVARELAESVLKVLPESRTRKAIVCVDAYERANLPSFLNAGCSRHLVRPVRPASLLREVLRDAEERDAGDVVDDRAGGRARQNGDAVCRSHGHCDAGQSLSILLAEDNAVNLLIARRVIENAGHRVTVVRNGALAVQHMRNAAQGDAIFPDLVLMDIMMPEMDGVEATQAIKGLFAGRMRQYGAATEACTGPQSRSCPPIIALTANAFVEDRQKYLEQGLDDYLSKPFEANELTALIDRWHERIPAGARWDERRSSS